ncbi:MAG: hypothetical protein IJ083_08955 [Clostridia bacterium]|nr:hypothetical protein [Clostridia bacterium]
MRRPATVSLCLFCLALLMCLVLGEARGELRYVHGPEIYVDVIGTEEMYVPLDILRRLYPRDSWRVSDGKVYREDRKGYALFDVEHQTVSFYGLNISAPISEAAEYVIRPTSVYETENRVATVDLSRWGFQMLEQDEKIYVPLTVMSALFMEEHGEVLFTDGQDIYFLPAAEALGILRQLKMRRTPEAIERNARALFFRLDVMYGLDAPWREKGFEAWLREKDESCLRQLLSSSESAYLAGMRTLRWRWIDDGHTRMLQGPRGTDPYGASEEMKRGTRMGSILSSISQVNWARSRGTKREKLHVYLDMAVLTIDEFTFDRFYWQGKPDIHALEDRDTVTFLITSLNALADRGDVRHVVLDLSANPGGDTDAVYFALAAMKGESTISMKNALTGSIRAESFTLQGMDGWADRFDFSILTSPGTFSGADLLAHICRIEGCAQIIGEKSGGGSCPVALFVDEFGSAIGYSCVWSMGTGNSEGTWENTDAGTEPDVKASIRDLADDRKLYALILQENAVNPAK